MILPINLTGRLGLPDGGVPNFTLDPQTGEVMGAQFWSQGNIDPATGEPMSGIDPATGEPLSADGGYTNDPGLWMSSSNPNQNILNTAPLRDSRGTQWNRRGSFLTESGFDKWRRAGKPTACSMSGLSAYTLADGTPCDPTVISAPICEDTTQRVLQAIAAGTSVAAQTIAPNPSVTYPGAIYPPGYVPGSGTLTVSGGMSAGAMLFGGLIIMGLIFAVSRR